MNQQLSELPPIDPFVLDGESTAEILIIAEGFEDRSLEVIGRYCSARRKPLSIVVIEYSPTNARNREGDVKRCIEQLGLKENSQLWLKYERFHPDSFEPAANKLRQCVGHANRLVVDISGMSRLLIALVLDAVKAFTGEVVVAYAEAGTYHPTKRDFESKKKSVKKSVPTFLTGDVFDIVGVLPFSSVSMQGHPRLMIAFPTFNPRELIALLNELSVQHLVLIEGRPHLEKDRWRLPAIRELNARSEEVIDVERFAASTFDYSETVSLLEKLYQKYGESHKILLAPTGSKLQTLGVFFFLQVRPDVQIVYPVTKAHLHEYTEGVAEVWQIKFPRYAHQVETLQRWRRAGLQALRAQIERLEPIVTDDPDLVVTS